MAAGVGIWGGEWCRTGRRSPAWGRGPADPAGQAKAPRTAITGTRTRARPPLRWVNLNLGIPDYGSAGPETNRDNQWVPEVEGYLKSRTNRFGVPRYPIENPGLPFVAILIAKPCEPDCVMPVMAPLLENPLTIAWVMSIPAAVR